MAATPQFKVYASDGRYMAATKEPEAAAAIVGFYGDGSTIRWGHSKIVWTEGTDGTACESYDQVAETVYSRI